MLTAGILVQVIAPALTDTRHRIAPTDFSAFWAGARLAASGRPQDAYDPKAAQAAQCVQAACDPTAPFPRPYFYPPVFLLLSLPFGLLPLPVALPLFVTGGYGVLAACLRRIAGVGWWLPILLSPGALLNVVTAQAGCFTASCFAGGVVLIDRHPGLAGFCLGLLVFKPQLAIGIPIVLLAARRWRALIACGGTALATCALSWGVLGEAAWAAFFERSRWAGALLREDVVWHRLVSVYGGVRLLRAGVPPAYVLQGLSAVAALGLVAWLASRRPDHGAEMAALVCGALLGTPYLWDYDLVCLTVPAAWLAGRAVQTGWRAWEKPALCSTYVLPVLARAANLSLGLPLAPCLTSLMLALIVARSITVPRA